MKYTNLTVNVGCLNHDMAEAIQADICDLLEKYNLVLHSMETIPEASHQEEIMQFYPDDM